MLCGLSHKIRILRLIPQGNRYDTPAIQGKHTIYKDARHHAKERIKRKNTLIREKIIAEITVFYGQIL
jgi:hypothetical protein